MYELADKGDKFVLTQTGTLENPTSIIKHYISYFVFMTIQILCLCSVLRSRVILLRLSVNIWEILMEKIIISKSKFKVAS